MAEKIAFLTLGCKLNYAETSTYERGFLQHGLQVVPWEEAADVYLVNTCSVTERAEKKCRNIIRKMHRIAPEAKLVVTGCYAELRKERLMAIEGVALVFGAREKNRVVPDTLALLGHSPQPAHARSRAGTSSGPGDAPLLSSREADTLSFRAADALSSRYAAGAGKSAAEAATILPAYSTGERTRAFLKIQDGCNNCCAYCTVPFARGRSRNIPAADVLAQAKQIAATGIREIVLTGVNTGDFGRTTGESFLDLLQRLDEVEGIDRYRISSIEPNLLTEEIVDWIASGTKFQPHFHIPLQSGSDTLLQRVGRRYTTDFFAERIEYVRRRMDPVPGSPEGNLKPYVFFGIDVIVGLPGETEELFRETYSFLKDRIRPAFLHIFPYSRRPGTRAAAWKDQVQDAVKTERVARLEALCADLHAAFVAANHGRHGEVLWESDCKDGRMGGYTGNYLRVERPFDPARINTLEDIIL